jgi:hypothetical protein
MKLWQTFLLMIQKLNTLMKTINKAVSVVSGVQMEPENTEK